MMSCHCTRNITLKLVPVLYNLSGDLVSKGYFPGIDIVQPLKWPWPGNDPQMDPEMIPTPKRSPFLFTSTPKWPPINYWNGMVFSDEIIASLLQCLRSWVTFNISRWFMLFLSTFVINLCTFMSTFFLS